MPPTPLLKAKVAIEATMDLGMHSNWRGHSTPDTHLCSRDCSTSPSNVVAFGSNTPPTVAYVLGTGRMEMFPEDVGSFHVFGEEQFYHP